MKTRITFVIILSSIISFTQLSYGQVNAEDLINFSDANTLDGGVVVEAGGNIGLATAGTYAEFDAVTFSNYGDYTVTINATHKGPNSALGEVAGNVEIIVNGVSLGTVDIEDTGNWNTYQDFTTTITIPSDLTNPAVVRFLFNPVGLETYAGNMTTVTFSHANGTGGTLSNDKYLLTGFSVYPTLVNDELTVNGLDQANYKIINLNGQVVLEGRLNSVISKIDVNTINSGVYLIKLNNESGEATVKFIKNN